MTKQIFTQSQQPEEEEVLPKQEFYNVETKTNPPSDSFFAAIIVKLFGDKSIHLKKYLKNENRS